MKKSIFKKPKFWIASIGLLVIIVPFVIILLSRCYVEKSIDEAVQKHTYSQSSKIIETTEKNEIKSISDGKETYYVDNISFIIPNKWEYEYENDNHISIITDSRNLVWVYSESKSFEEAKNDVYEDIKVKEETGNVDILIDETTTIADVEAQNIFYWYYSDTVNWFESYYIIYYNEKSYILHLYDTYDSEDLSTFNIDFINSIEFL